MMKYMYVGSIHVPSYGAMIILGFVVCNLIAQRSLKSERDRYSDFLIIEICGGIGAVLGAKLLVLLESAANGSDPILSWNEFKELGYSYYGGLAGFFITAYAVCKACKIDGDNLAREYVFLLPLMHAFWKIGCLLGGCCFGRPYEGPFAIVYPAGVNAVSQMRVFPSPVAETCISLLIALVLLLAGKFRESHSPAGLYPVMYGTARFFLEFMRYHEDNGYFSAVHLYSVIAVVIGMVFVMKDHRRKNCE